MDKIEFIANVSSVRTGGIAGGYRLGLSIPETDIISAAKLLGLYNLNVKVAIEPLPDE